MTCRSSPVILFIFSHDLFKDNKMLSMRGDKLSCCFDSPAEIDSRFMLKFMSRPNSLFNDAFIYCSYSIRFVNSEFAPEWSGCALIPSKNALSPTTDNFPFCKSVIISSAAFFVSSSGAEINAGILDQISAIFIVVSLIAIAFA